jgi:pyridoxamine 5'-phosphate oxidase
MPGVTNVAPDGPGPVVDLTALRRAYADTGLTEADLVGDPMDQLQRWLADVVAAGITEPNAMVVATVDPDGAPSARMVLLKGLDSRGPVFFTNLGSRKGLAIAHEARVSIVFPWHPIERQVRVEGVAEQVSAEETRAYFDSRPFGSRIGAWASPQSRVVPDRADLDRRWTEAASRFPEGSEVPVPPEWGGIRVRPTAVEFWQGRSDRMHDRLRYRRTSDGWAVERLAP